MQGSIPLPIAMQSQAILACIWPGLALVSTDAFVETLHSVGQATTKTYSVGFAGHQGQLQSLREQHFTALIDPSFSSIKFLLISTVELLSGGKNFSTLKTNFSTLFHRPTYPRYHLPTHLRPYPCRSSSGVAFVHSATQNRT